jgi:hypothetical protein
VGLSQRKRARSWEALWCASGLSRWLLMTSRGPMVCFVLRYMIAYLLLTSGPYCTARARLL